jgi:hypothetical protein
MAHGVRPPHVRFKAPIADALTAAHAGDGKAAEPEAVLI